MAVNLCAFNEKLIDVIHVMNGKPDQDFTDCLSKKIWDFYLKNSPNYKLLNQKIRLKHRLSEMLSKYFNELGNGFKFVDIFISGSTVNGFATLDSDIDLCFIVTDFFDYDFVKAKTLKILTEVEELLFLNDFKIEDSQLIEARVPILRYIDSDSKTRVEINVNNEIGIRNTRLLYCYSKLDWRVVPICISIKRWAKYTSIIDSYSGALSSFTVELMVIFYLQNCLPPLLPCLQRTNPEMFDMNTEISEYRDPPNLGQLAPFASSSHQSLAKLFVGFFDFYLHVFDFTKHVASVRLGRALKKSRYQPFISDPNQWEYICIEEPFSRSNTGRTVYDGTAYNTIVTGFRQMYENSVYVTECRCDLNLKPMV